MARRISTGARSAYLPQLPDGIRASDAHLRHGHPGLSRARLDQLNGRETFVISATDVWTALYKVDPAEAEAFGRQHGGPWPFHDPPLFTFDPRTNLLQPVQDPNPRSHHAG